MKLALSWIALLAVPCSFALLAPIGCGSTSNGAQPFGDGGTPDGGGGPAEEPQDPPHALGSIFLGETHAAGKSTVTPIVSAAFVPDTAGATKACTKTIAGCELFVAPSCECNDGEVCTMDSACKSKCVKPCTASCKSDEECYFATSSTAACRKREAFNAGALAFAGTTTPITLFPPYSFTATDMHGAPFLAGAKIQVQASGATEAGFEKFDETFTATSFLQTNPSLDKIAKSTVFGSGSVPIGWEPGADAIVITVSGPGGSATCKADDAAGKFDLPRTVIQAVSGEAGGTPTLALSVSRQRKEVKKDLKTKGTMTTATVQSLGFVELTTASMESTSFVGCYSGETMCDDECVDLRSSSENCGACGHVCSGGYCESGKCPGDPTPPDAGGGKTCAACTQAAMTGACKAKVSACQASPECLALDSCVRGCSDTTCQDNCVDAHPDGLDALNGVLGCYCDTACVTECKAECSGN